MICFVCLGIRNISDENILIYSILELEESGDQLLRRIGTALTSSLSLTDGWR